MHLEPLFSQCLAPGALTAWWIWAKALVKVKCYTRQEGKKIATEVFHLGSQRSAPETKPVKPNHTNQRRFRTCLASGRLSHQFLQSSNCCQAPISHGFDSWQRRRSILRETCIMSKTLRSSRHSSLIMHVSLKIERLRCQLSNPWEIGA